MQGHQTKTKTKDAISLDYSSICYIASRIGWMSMKGIYKLKIDVDVILEKLSNKTIPLLTSSDYGDYK